MGASKRSYPAYLTLFESGELKRRSAEAVASLAQCRSCPRDCQIDRLQDQKGICHVGRWARIGSYSPHLGEEDCLRGWSGSGTIFFSGCNLRCVFCQNWDVSQEAEGQTVSAQRLAKMMLELQKNGCHNINWVTPEHVVPQALEALLLAVEQGLRLPIVYNSSGFDSLQNLRWMDGIIDIYMPDFKVWETEAASRLLNDEHYPEVARAVIKEMHRQVGDLTFDQDGLARRGLLVRHLVMPHNVAGFDKIAHWLATEISPDTYINLMDQYHPAGAVLQVDAGARCADVAGPITEQEFRDALADARLAGLHRFEHQDRR